MTIHMTAIPCPTSLVFLLAEQIVRFGEDCNAYDTNTIVVAQSLADRRETGTDEVLVNPEDLALLASEAAETGSEPCGDDCANQTEEVPCHPCQMRLCADWAHQVLDSHGFTPWWRDPVAPDRDLPGEIDTLWQGDYAW